MRVTKSQLKQLIKEELRNVLNEARDPAKLKAAAAYMKSHETISMYLSQAQGGGRPPEVQVNGMYVGNWLAAKTGYSLEEIMKVANQKPSPGAPTKPATLKLPPGALEFERNPIELEQEKAPLSVIEKGRRSRR